LARLIAIVAAVLLLAGAVGAACAADNPYLPAQDPVPLLAAIEAETPEFVPPAGVTGITVPHHLLAADLIARGFWAASAGQYERIIVISPDHFHKVGEAFGTTREDLETVFGTLRSDAAGVEAIAASPLVEVLPTIETEHGVMAVAPFAAHFFPEARVIPLLASVRATEADWDAMAELLLPLLTPRTLVVQSTDYSHYRPIGEAVVRDQESIAAIAAGDPAGISPLLQPAHMDSKAAQYIQMALQRALGARPVILANRNSVEYGGNAGETTSYVVTAYLRDAAAGTAFDYADEARVMFAGDVLLGRYFLPALRDPEAWGLLRDTVLGITRGTKLIVNFEGVLLDKPVVGLDFNAHLMMTEDAAPTLTALNVGAASLANNHANDLGPGGRAETVTQLERIGVVPLEHGSVTDMGAFRLLALNFVGGKMVGEAIADADDLGWVCGLDAAPPLVAFVHWGEEYVTAPGDRERRIADTLARCGVTLIVGGHSHQAAEAIEPLRGGAAQSVFSLGNFIFDQSSPRGAGALLEVRVFRQGTVAARLVPVPNLFELTKQGERPARAATARSSRPGAGAG
jgi:poly-gamma-glutamate synthesis protein (capsule biosynthesis protein)